MKNNITYLLDLQLDRIYSFIHFGHLLKGYYFLTFKMFTYFILFVTVLPLNSQPQENKQLSILPRPGMVKWLPGQFELTSETRIVGIKEAKEAIDILTEKLSRNERINQKISNYSKQNQIQFFLDKSLAKQGDGAYLLNIKSNGISISANERSGFFYAIQTLLQLLPLEIVSKTENPPPKILLPCVSIVDKPKYSWRSFLLDSGRQFQSVEFIKRYLDYLAMMKINVFHWHLTEGQGWRIEIKKYPKLTSIGSQVATGEEQKGYYSQDDIKEIVEYANKLCITVVPEIDVPGHSEAALIAYPEYSCTKKAPESVMGFSSNLFCGGNEETYVFLKNILDEVCDLFPSEYIHLGGDEAPKDNWDNCPVCQDKIIEEGLKNSDELQIYFSIRLANYLNNKSKKVILWGDVIENSIIKLPKNVVIYWWNYRKMNDIAYKNAREIGNKVICGTNYYTYLNYPVTPWSRYKEDRTFDLRDIHDLNPSDIQNPDSLVMGMGSCLWTDWNVKMSMIDKRVFPRILALADQMWSTNEKTSFSEYYKIIRGFYPRLKVLGINYGPALREEVQKNYSWE